MSALCRRCAAGKGASARALHDGDVYVRLAVPGVRFITHFAVTCRSLLCRSPGVVIGYLMRLRRWPLNESYKWVHDRRSVVSLQEGDAHPAVLFAELHRVTHSRVFLNTRASKANRRALRNSLTFVLLRNALPQQRHELPAQSFKDFTISQSQPVQQS